MNQQSNPATAAARWTGWLVLALTLVWLVWASAKLFWAVLPAPESIDPAAAPTALRNASPTSGVDVAALHLFGQPLSESAPVAQTAPETELNLALLGTFAAEDPQGGIAIIADDQSNQGSYRVGDELPGNATLKEVHVDRIVLERLGRRESLHLTRAEPGASGRSASRGAAASGPTQSTPRATNLGSVDWQAAQNNARIDPAMMRQLGQQIRALPFTENGQPVGVRLMAGSNSEILSKLGLRSSDIILSVNGIPLTDPARQFELLELLNKQTQFQVRLRRSGREMTLNIDSSQIQTP
ncbi:MAG: type II secretion system protein GspC [Xanthomonadales bacterium]|nr:type II secretion system protein GspC [Xanthomonadales bacterium]